MKMKYFLVIVLFSVIISSCNKNESETEATQLPEGMHEIKVKETLNSGGYTYINASEGEKEYWIAVPEMKVEEDEKLYYSQAMEMKDFHSSTLDKTFPSILFVSDISKTINKPVNSGGGMNPQMGGNMMGESMQHPSTTTSEKSSDIIKQNKGGKSVSDIFSMRNKLDGEIVEIKGKVMKVNSEIMGRNWIHLQDGTSYDNKYDLIITSKGNVNVGDIILIKGKVSIDKDFGAGYKYEVIIEDAEII